MQNIRLSSARLAVIGLVVALLGTLAWVQAGPARAEEPFQGCGANQLCLYDATGGRVTPDAAFGDTTAASSIPAITAVDFKNTSNRWACLYDWAAYGGSLRSVAPGTEGTFDFVFTSGPPTPGSYKFSKTAAGCWTGFERCQAGDLCIYKGHSGRALGTTTAQKPIDPAKPEGPAGNKDYGDDTWDKKIGSVYNRSGRIACFYADRDYKGSWPPAEGTQSVRAFVVPNGASISLAAPYDQSFRSHKLVDNTSEC